MQIPAQTYTVIGYVNADVSGEVQQECGFRGMERPEGIEHVNPSACRDQQEAVGMGMHLLVEAREGQRACECIVCRVEDMCACESRCLHRPGVH